jgi:hypothetical protein
MTTLIEPWAIDDLILSDGLTENGDWLSVLRNARGLPRVGLKRAERQGRWPVISDVARLGDQKFLETWFGAVPDLGAAIKLYNQYLNPELQEVRRLLVGDHVVPGCAPDNVMLSLAAWDIYRDASAWYVRDLLQQVTGTLAGGWRVWPSGGGQFAEATTNKVLNPVAGAAGNFAALAAATVTRDTAYHFEGWGDYAYSYKVAATAAANDGMRLTLSALANAIHYVTVRLRGDFPTTTMRWSLDGATWNQPALLGTDTGADGETWSVYGYAFPAVQANGSTVLYIRQTDATARTYYVDGAQVEQSTYPTPLCTGDMGPGHSWSGTEHASTSARTKTELSFALTMPSAWTVYCWLAMATADWAVSATTQNLWRWGGAADYVTVHGVQANDQLRVVWENSGGANYFKAITAVDPTAYTYMFVAVTFDTADMTLKAYFNPTTTTPATSQVVDALLAVNPTTLYVGMNNGGGLQINGLIDDLWVLSRALTGAEVLRVYNAGRDWRARWLDVLCEYAGVREVGGRRVHRAREADLVVDGDVRWRSRDGDVHVWRCWDADEETTLDNQGDDDAYPVIYITPKTAKTADYAYKRWVPFIWKTTSAATTYPCLLGPIDTTGLVGGGKMQADGDDWRVFVNGTEVDRWFGATTGNPGGPDSATTKTWVNLDFAAAGLFTLAVAFGAGDTVETIQVNEDISAMPSSGILYLENGAAQKEAFTYTGKSDALKRFTGVTRAAKGTTARAFVVNDDVYWIQHDVWILYGDATATAPSTDDRYMPAFNLQNSTNDVWDYDDFGDVDGAVYQPASWQQQSLEGWPTFYTANHVGSASPWSEVGLECWLAEIEGRWLLHNVCGIADVNFSNGEKWCDNRLYFLAWVKSSVDGSSWTTEYTIPVPAANSNWEAWSYNPAGITSNSKYICLQVMSHWIFGPTSRAEVADVLLSLNATSTPDHEILAEQGNYTLAATITNNETDEAIQVDFTMELDQTLEVDTTRKVVTYLADDSRQQQAMTTVGGARRDWLRLVAGENTLAFEDTGTNELEIEIVWDRRYVE